MQMELIPRVNRMAVLQARACRIAFSSLYAETKMKTVIKIRFADAMYGVLSTAPKLAAQTILFRSSVLAFAQE
jgi:hypothetical protein